MAWTSHEFKGAIVPVKNLRNFACSACSFATIPWASVRVCVLCDSLTWPGPWLLEPAMMRSIKSSTSRDSSRVNTPRWPSSWVNTPWWPSSWPIYVYLYVYMCVCVCVCVCVYICICICICICIYIYIYIYIHVYIQYTYIYNIYIYIYIIKLVTKFVSFAMLQDKLRYRGGPLKRRRKRPTVRRGESGMHRFRIIGVVVLKSSWVSNFARPARWDAIAAIWKVLRFSVHWHLSK